MKKKGVFFIILATLTLIGSHAAADDLEDELNRLKASTELAMMKVFQRMEYLQMKDSNPDAERDRQDSVGYYINNKDYIKAMGFIQRLDNAGELTFPFQDQKERVTDIIYDMKRYPFKSSECSKVYVYQILHAYNQGLDQYFEADDSKIRIMAKIARKLLGIENDFEEVAGPENKVFSRYRTHEDRRWEEMIETASEYNRLFCKWDE